MHFVSPSLTQLFFERDDPLLLQSHRSCPDLPPHNLDVAAVTRTSVWGWTWTMLLTYRLQALKRRHLWHFVKIIAVVLINVIFRTGRAYVTCSDKGSYSVIREELHSYIFFGT